MLPDIGFAEYLVIAIAALVFIGPKDLPKVLRVLGQWVNKMRGMAAEFRASFDDMARQSELDDLRKEVDAMRKGQLLDPARLAADDASQADIDQTFADIDAGLRNGGMLHSPMGGGYSMHDTPEMTPIEGPAESAAPKKAARKRAAATKTAATTPAKPRASRARTKA